MKKVVWGVLSVLILHSITEVTSQRSPWFPEQCDKTYKYRCGDICVTDIQRCYCGEDDWGWYDDEGDKRYCCVPPGDSRCTKVDPNEEYKYNVNCSSGVLLPWYQPCHADNCAGSPVVKKNNCEFDCLARTDEVSVKENEKNIDQYADLQNCNSSNADPGLNGTITDGACKLNWKWCTEDIPCQTEVSRDRLQLKRFCQNSTFWESLDCNDYHKLDGTVVRYGERCSGSQKHCMFPSYLQYDYETYRADGRLPQCKDKSDQIFERQSKCDMRKHLDIYCDHCQDNRSNMFWWKNKTMGDCVTKCANKTKFIQEQAYPHKQWKSDHLRNDVLDPHNCQASCLKAEYGCTACENKKYFNCSSSFKCLHPDLVCDGVPQCPSVPPSTEPEDEQLERCKEKGVFISDAIMKCQSIFYPEVTILAVPCNGLPECADNADEPWICTNTTTIISGGVGGIFATLILVFVYFKVKSLKRKNKDTQFGKLLIFNVRDWHINESFRSFGIFSFLAVNNVSKQTEILENISTEEEKFHKSNEFQTMLWIKNAYSKFEISLMAESLYPSSLKKIFFIGFVLERFEKLTHSFKILWWLFDKVRQISFVYIDLTKDILITITLLSMIGINTIIVSPTAFPSVVVMCLIVSIVMPLLMSSLQLARDHPEIIYGEDFYNQSRWRQVLGRIGIVLMAPVNPALFVHAFESNQQQLRFQDLEDKKYEEIKKIGKKGEVIQRQYVRYIRTELGFEAILQLGKCSLYSPRQKCLEF